MRGAAAEGGAEEGELGASIISTRVIATDGVRTNLALIRRFTECEALNDS